MTTRQNPLPSKLENSGSLFSLAPLRRQIDRLFEDFGYDWLDPTPFGTNEAGYLPTADFHEGDKDITIRVELPGVDVKDVQISATDRTIRITGEKKSESERKDGDRYVSERTFGLFERTFELPYAVDPANIDAKFDKGVLQVTIGKPAEAQNQSRRIQIHG